MLARYAILLLLSTVTNCAEKARDRSGHHPQTAEVGVVIRIASPDRSLLTEEELALLTGYQLNILPEPGSCTASETKIVNGRGQWTASDIKTSLKLGCDFRVQVALGELDDTGQLGKIHYTYKGQGELLTKKFLAARAEIAVHLISSREAGEVADRETETTEEAGEKQKEPEPKEPETPSEEPKAIWDRFEPDSEFHNIFDGVSWRIRNGFLEVANAPLPMGSETLVASCLKLYRANFDRWSKDLAVKAAHLYATAVTETGCENVSGSSDGLSAGMMQVTGKTCVGVMKNIEKTYTADGCKSAMAQNPDFSIEVGTRYIAEIATSLAITFSPIAGMKSDLGPALDPPKVAAGYNAGALRSTTGNRWHLVVTADHIDRYVNAYNAFVAFTKKERAGLFTGRKVRTMTLARNPRLPVSVGIVAELDEYSGLADEGNSIFVGDFAAKAGEFYFWFAGRWRAASDEW